MGSLTILLYRPPGIEDNIADKLFADIQFADNQIADMQFADNQIADIQFTDNQIADIHFADSKFTDNQFADIQFTDSFTDNLYLFFKGLFPKIAASLSIYGTRRAYLRM